MRGISWKSLLTGMVVIIALVAVSFVMLSPLTKFNFLAYGSLQPIIGTPGDPKFDNLNLNNVETSEAYRTIIWDCRGDCRSKGESPQQICRNAGGDGWNAVFVDCDRIDATGEITFAPRDLTTPWDSDAWGWCHNDENPTDEDIAVTCYRGVVNVKAVLVDCKTGVDNPCKSGALTPENICQTTFDPTWHAYGVDCGVHDGNPADGSALIKDFSTSWNGAGLTWCKDTDNDDMVVFCTDEAGFDTNDYKVLLYECKDPPKECDRAIDSSLDVLCQKFLPGDWRAINVDCRHITIAENNPSSYVFTRSPSEVWGKYITDPLTESGGVGWCMQDINAFDLAITCKREKIEYECNDDTDNDKDGKIDYDGNGDPTKIDPGCYSDIDNDEKDTTYPNMELGVVVKECNGACYDRFNAWSPTDWCHYNFSNDWYAINLDCDNLGTFLDKGKNNWIRKLNQVWDVNSFDVDFIKIGWCQDGQSQEDVAITCLNNNTGKNVRIADIKAVIYDCGNDPADTCQKLEASPVKLCQNLGLGWQPFGVDCDVIDIQNRENGVFVRSLDKLWGQPAPDGGSLGWCENTFDAGGEDMAVFCTNKPIITKDIKVVIINCWGDCYKIAGWSADRMCKDTLQGNYRAIMVDTTNTEIDPIGVPEMAPQVRYFSQRWYQDLNPNGYVGWAAESNKKDMAIFCVPDSFSLFVS